MHARNPVNLPRLAGRADRAPAAGARIEPAVVGLGARARAPHRSADRRARRCGGRVPDHRLTPGPVRRRHPTYGRGVHTDRQLLEERITRELYERVVPLVERDRRRLVISAGPSPTEQAPFEVGTHWGPPWATTWFTFTGEVPDAWAGGAVEAVVDLGFRGDDGRLPVRRSGRRRRRPTGAGHPPTTHPAPSGCHSRPGDDPARGGLQSIVSPVPAVDRSVHPTRPAIDRSTGSERAELVLVDAEAEALVHDLDVLDGVMRTLAEHDPRRARLLRTIVRRTRPVAPMSPRSRSAVRATHSAVHAPGQRPPRRSPPATPTSTRRGCGRSARRSASARARSPPRCALMDDVPGLPLLVLAGRSSTRGSSSASPSCSSASRARSRGGQWVPVGGMWVEADMNLPSGESLVRQIVHGQRCFEQPFGVRCTRGVDPRRVRLPGRRCRRSSPPAGCDRFVTQKLSLEQARTASRTTRSGGRARRHAGADPLPAGRHLQRRGHARGDGARRASDFREHAWSDWSLMPFGYGDGGGGPTREMLERARRMADLDGVPRRRARLAGRVLRPRRGARSPPARRCRCGAASCTSRRTAAR